MMETPRDEQENQPHQNGSAPKLGFSFGENPGRRFGERSNIVLPDSTEVRRLFGREGRQEPSDFHPAPRPRDEKGLVQARTIVHDPAMPDPVVMREKYAAALDLIRQYRPFRAALLEDMLGRIEHSLTRFRRLESGEEQRFQNRNEEFRRADTWLDNRIGELRAEREKLVEGFDTQVAERLQALAQAREVASVARVVAGLPLHFKDLEEEMPLDAESTSPAKADLAGLAQAAVQTALPVLASSPLQKAGNFLSRLRGQSSLSVQGSLPSQPLPSHSPISKAYPDGVPFPLEEGYAQARPEIAIAVEQGLPYRSPAALALEGKQRWLSWVALVACGSLFGISMGLLTQVLNIDLVSLNPGRAWGEIAVLMPLGIAMFWVLGRVVFAVAAIASEERHAHLVASHRDDTVEVGKWLKKASFWALILLPVTGIVLVVVESMVERFGIVRVFADGTKNAAFASGQDAVASAQPPEYAIFCLVLTVSLPFVLFHMAEGWVHTRDRVISQYLTGRRHKEGWEIAQKCHQERTARTVACFDAALEAEREQIKATAAAAVVAPAAALTIQAGIAETPAVSDTAIPASDTNTFLGEPSAIEPPIRMADVALVMERARECFARVREARAQRHEALAWHETRIAAYEAERQQERTDPENSSKLRLEDAYSDYMGAVLNFDKTYHQEMLHIEKLMRGGLLVRFWLTLFQRPVMG